MAEKRTYTPKKTSPKVDLEVGKMPPQALEIEEAVLGALMLEKDAFTAVGEILKPECFYKDTHQKIYAAIQTLNAKDRPVDMLTVTEELRNLSLLEEVGGAFFITQLTGRVASAAHIEYHARIIWQKYLQREVIRISSEIQTKAYDDSIDVDDLLDESESSFFKLSQGNMKKGVMQINPIIDEAIEMIKLASQREDGMSGVPSGFHELDRITSGWQKTDMIVIAARPAMGKTAFVLSMARNMALDFGQAVAVFSLEMGNVQLVNRLIVAETELPAEKIKKGNLASYEWEQLDHKIQNLIDAPIYIDDSAGLSIFELRAKARRLKKEHDIQVIIIDYLQLMNANGMNAGSRQEEVSLISRSLKGLAKELNIPIIALSQLNRGVEGRAGAEGKRPQLSDLRESGAIEQDADMVCFIHRPEYYRITEDEQGNSLIGIGEIIVAKHRNGATGDVRLRFRAELARFENPETGVFGSDLGTDAGGQSVTYGSKMNEPVGSEGFGGKGGNNFNLPDFPQNPNDRDMPF